MSIGIEQEVYYVSWDHNVKASVHKGVVKSLRYANGLISGYWLDNGGGETLAEYVFESMSSAQMKAAELTKPKPVEKITIKRTPANPGAILCADSEVDDSAWMF